MPLKITAMRKDPFLHLSGLHPLFLNRMLISGNSFFWAVAIPVVFVTTLLLM